jgi:hypothetical protein
VRIAAFWLAAAAAALVGLVLAEVVDLAAWLSPKIVRAAASRMPTSDLRERYGEEWLAELSAFDGLKLIKLGKAISLWLSSWRVAGVLRSGTDVITTRTYLKSLSVSYAGAFTAIRHGRPIAPHDNPDLTLLIFAGNLMLKPMGRELAVNSDEGTRSPDGSISLIFTLSCTVTVTAQVSRLLALNALLAVTCYDLYILRRRTPLRKAVTYHRKAWRAVQGSRRSV